MAEKNISRPGSGVLTTAACFLVLALAVLVPYVPAMAQTTPVSMQLKPVAMVEPVMPPLVRPMRLQGVVILSVTVGPDGRPLDVRLVSGHPLLQQSAIDAVRQWLFEVPIIDGKPGTAVTSAQVRFVAEVDSGPPPVQRPAGLFGPVLIDRVDPVYPPQAVQAGIQGVVFLDVTVEADGQVSNAKLVGGPPLLAQAAIDAISKWKYQAASRDGRAASVEYRIGLDFTLNNGVPSITATHPNPASNGFRGSLALKGENFNYRTSVIPALQQCQCFVVFGVSAAGYPSTSREYSDDLSKSLSQQGTDRLASEIVAVRLVGDGRNLEITCRSNECTLTSATPNSSTAVQSLMQGQSTIVSASADITISF